MVPGSTVRARIWARRATASGRREPFSQLLKEALRLDPDHEEAKRVFKLTRRAKTAYTQAESATTHRQFDAAVEQYTLMLTNLAPPSKSPLSSPVHAKRAHARLGVLADDAGDNGAGGARESDRLDDAAVVRAA